MDERVGALHPTNVSMGDLKSDHTVKVDLLTLYGRERISTAKESEYLFFLFLPG